MFVYGRPAPLAVGDGEDISRGGIVTALVALTRLLAARGHEVHVFARCPQPGRFAGVAFHDRAELARFSESQVPDVLVVIPDLLPLLMPIRARARVLWTGNAFANGDCALTAPWPWAPAIGRSGQTARLYPIGILEPLIDLVVVKSRWQAGYVSGHHGVPSDKITVIHNGVPLERYDGPAPARHSHRIVYTSQPRRGLDVLLRLFPRIRTAVPDAELHIFGYDLDSTVGHLERAAQPGVVVRGSVTKSRLAHELRSAGVMAYPCTFKETFCTSVAEAQAAGLPVVVTGRAALPERVHDAVNGTVVPGEPGDPGFDWAFADAVVRLLRDDDLRRRQGAAATATARQDYDWTTITATWETSLREVVDTSHEHAPLAGLDLLDPSLLRIADRGHTAEVPPSQAAAWLVDAWASYGLDVTKIPGLPDPHP